MAEQPSAVEPLDPPMVPIMLAGTGGWTVAGLVLLAAGAPDGWLWTCLAGLALGVVLTVLMAIRRWRQERRTGSSSVSS